MGEGGAANTESLLYAAYAKFCPDKVIIPVYPSDKEAVELLKTLNSKAVEMALSAWDGKKAVAIVCSNFTCKEPTSDPAALSRQLGERKKAGSSAGPVKVDLKALGLDK